MRIAVIDDNKEYSDYLTEEILTWFTETKSTFKTSITPLTPGDFLTRLEKHECNFDIIFLDIKLGAYNGIDLANMVNQINPKCCIVFITNYLNLATEVYDVQHTYFILKTELKKRLPLALEKTIETVLSFKEKNYFLIMHNSHKIRLDSEDLIYAEVYGRKLTLHLTKEELTCNYTLKNLHSQLPDFLRIHNSYLVNPAFVRSLTKDSCLLNTQTTLPVSRTFQKKASESYNHYLASLL